MCNSAIAQRQGKVNNMKILGTEITYARAMALQCSQRYYDTRNPMAHELASRPASMFDDSGAMKVAKTKAVLKNTLKVEMERRHAEVDASFLDGCAVLWSCYGLQVELCKTSSTTSVDTSKVIWIKVVYTCCSTDTMKAVSKSPPEITEIKEPVECILCVQQPNFLLRKLFLP